MAGVWWSRAGVRRGEDGRWVAAARRGAAVARRLLLRMPDRWAVYQALLITRRPLA